MKDLISVIVPIYNVKKYLHKCVDSIINQTYRNLEIILVDDGSTDGSAKICDDYKKIDNRIIVIHKKNGGVSETRNYGLDTCRGKYITFIDSDDTIDSIYIDYLYHLIKSYNSKISICGFKYISKNGKQINKISTEDKTIFLNHLDALKTLLYENIYPNSSTSILYLADLFKDIRFPNGQIYEDVNVVYKLIDKCDKLVYGEKQLYNYLIRSDSITQVRFSKEKMNCVYFAEEMCEHLTKKYPNLGLAASSRIFGSCIPIVNSISLDDIENLKYLNYSVSVMKKYRIKTIFSKCLKKNKIYAMASFFGIKFLKKVVSFRRVK